MDYLDDLMKVYCVRHHQLSQYMSALAAQAHLHSHAVPPPVPPPVLTIQPWQHMDASLCHQHMTPPACFIHCPPSVPYAQHSSLPPGIGISIILPSLLIKVWWRKTARHAAVVGGKDDGPI